MTLETMNKNEGSQCNIDTALFLMECASDLVLPGQRPQHLINRNHVLNDLLPVDEVVLIRAVTGRITRIRKISKAAA